MSNGVLTVKYKKVRLCYDNDYTAYIDIARGDTLLSIMPKFTSKIVPGFGTGKPPELNVKAPDGYRWLFPAKRNNKFISTPGLFYDGEIAQDSLSDGNLLFSVRPILHSTTDRPGEIDEENTKVLDRDKLKGYFGEVSGVAIVFEYC